MHSFARAHPLGIHHVAACKDGKIAASAGFGGETFLWDLQELKQLGNVGGIFPILEEVNVAENRTDKIQYIR